MVTRDEFEAKYNGGNIIGLLARGRLSIECRCEEDICEGWKMGRLEGLDDDIRLYGNTQQEVENALAHREAVLKQANLEGHIID